MYLDYQILRSHLTLQQDKLSEDPWSPFTYSEGIPTGGIAVGFTKEIFKRLGVKYEIRLYPWERCLHQMKKGWHNTIWNK